MLKTRDVPVEFIRRQLLVFVQPKGHVAPDLKGLDGGGRLQGSGQIRAQTRNGSSGRVSPTGQGTIEEERTQELDALSLGFYVSVSGRHLSRRLVTRLVDGPRHRLFSMFLPGRGRTSTDTVRRSVSSMLSGGFVVGS